MQKLIYFLIFKILLILVIIIINIFILSFYQFFINIQTAANNNFVDLIS